MELGDRGNDVKKLQELLIDEGLLETKEKYFGPETKRAVVKLQIDLGLEPTGIWNESYLILYKIKRG